MYHFATLFDQNYLSRGLCLIESLDRVLNDNYSLYILALDENVVDYFVKNQRPNIIVLTLNQLEEFYPELVLAKTNRSKVEYYFTLSPILPLYILENFKDCERITTLDSDIYFYSSPAEIFKTYDTDAVLITPHDFSSRLQDLVRYGKYNVSFQSFPNTVNGLSVLKDWKEKCITWCYDYQDPETGYYADQKYLDDWKQHFDKVKSIDLKTCGRAPWNISDTALRISNGEFRIGDQLLIYYHFHSLRINDRCVTHGLQGYEINGISDEVKKVYSIYILALYKYNKKINQLSDKAVIRININSKSSSIFHFILHSEIGAIVLSSKRVVFFNMRIKTNLIRLRNYLKWQS